MENKSYSLEDLCQRLGGDLHHKSLFKGSLITALGDCASAKASDIAVLANAKYLKDAEATKAGVLLVSSEIIDKGPAHLPLIEVGCVKTAWIQIAQLFYDEKRQVFSYNGIAETADIHETADVHESATIGANTVIGPYSKIGKNVCIGANATIGRLVVIGDDSQLYPSTCVMDSVTIGKRCRIESGSVIGAEGFGNFLIDSQWRHIPHLGSVIIGDDVLIGASTVIDRGTICDTHISTNVILDNHIHVAHNVQIGPSTAIAAKVAVAGSATIGSYCRIGGATSIADHIDVCDHVDLVGGCSIRQSICKPGVYGSISGYPLPYVEWMRSAIHLKKINHYIKQFKLLFKRESQ